MAARGTSDQEQKLLIRVVLQPGSRAGFSGLLVGVGEFAESGQRVA